MNALACTPPHEHSGIAGRFVLCLPDGSQARGARSCSMPPPFPRPLVCFLELDGLLVAPTRQSCKAAASAFASLERQNVAVVLCSEKPRGELAHLARALGFWHPFVAEGGNALCLPHAYFTRIVPDAVPGSSWDVIECEPTDDHGSGSAILRLRRLFFEFLADVEFVGVASPTRTGLVARVLDNCIVDSCNTLRDAAHLIAEVVTGKRGHGVPAVASMAAVVAAGYRDPRGAAGLQFHPHR
jgi:hypothetical protein